MLDTGTITIFESGLDLVFEWKIEDFFNLPERDGAFYCSPDFAFGGERWHLTIFPNGSSRNDSSGHLDLDLWKWTSGRSIKQSFSLSLKTAKGEKYKEQHCTKDFDNVTWYHRFNRFMPKSELSRRRSDLAPEGTLTVICTMKSSTLAGSDKEGASNAEVNKSDVPEASGSNQAGTTTTRESGNTAYTSDKCCHCKEAFDAESLPSHQKRCMHRPTKCPDCLEVVVLQKWLDEHDCLKERSEDYNIREKLRMVLCINCIIIAVVTGSALAYCKIQLAFSHPCGEINSYKQEIQKMKENLQVAEKMKDDLLVTISEKTNKIADIEAELYAFKGQLDSTKGELSAKDTQLKDLKKDLVMSNEQLQEKIAQLEAVAETLKARESELNAIKKEHGGLKRTYESIASLKNKLQHCLDSEKQNLVQLKKEMEEKQSKIDSIAKELRNKETDFNDLKNKNEKLIFKIKKIESEKKLLEEKATENENHNSPKGHEKQLVLYAATIIIFVIALACVYDYSKTSLSTQPYGEGTQTISAEEDNIINADLSEVAETDKSEDSDSKSCAIETEGPVSFKNLPEDYGAVTDINHLLKENRGVDVTFELETSSGETKLFAHKLILAVMSSYFADEFYGKGRNKGHRVIPLKGINPKAFEQMIRYFYDEKPIFKTTEEACVLFKIASEFKVISLQNLCCNFFRHTKINPGNAFSILEISEEMEDKSLKDKCRKILQDKTREFMAFYELRDVTPAMVHILLDLPSLSLDSEYELIKWIFDWAKVKSEDKDSSCRSNRDYLAKLLQNINFLALTVEEFAILSRENPKVFNSDERASISLNIACPGSWEMPVWYNKDLKLRLYTGSI